MKYYLIFAAIALSIQPAFAAKGKKKKAQPKNTMAIMSDGTMQSEAKPRVKKNKESTQEPQQISYHEWLADPHHKYAIDTSRPSKNKPQLNKPQLFEGNTYAGHALDRIEERGTNLIEVAAVLMHGQRYRSSEGNQLRVDTNKKIGAIFDPRTKTVITVLSDMDQAELSDWQKRQASPSPTQQKVIEERKIKGEQLAQQARKPAKEVKRNQLQPAQVARVPKVMPSTMPTGKKALKSFQFMFDNGLYDEYGDDFDY